MAATRETSRARACAGYLLSCTVARSATATFLNNSVNLEKFGNSVKNSATVIDRRYN